jgi:photosystem II stability/assembly factor-like uncharacterized protein
VSRARLICAAGLVAFSGALSAGENVWTTHGPPGNSFSLVLDNATLILYSGTRLEDNRTVVFRSSDHGMSWTESAAAPQNTSLTVLAVAQTTPAAEYAITESFQRSTVYRSIDEGSTWTVLGPEIPFFSAHSLTVALEIPRVLYVGGTAWQCVRLPCYVGLAAVASVVKSMDFGATWVALYMGLSGSAIRAVSVDSSVLYAGGDAGVFVSADFGDHWAASNAGLETCPNILSLAVRSTDGALFAASGRIVSNRFDCGGVFRSVDGGRTWAPTGLSPHYVTSLAIDPTDPQIIYAGAERIGFFSPEGGVFRSMDGGERWAPLGSGLPDGGVNQLVIESSGRTVHASTSEGVFDYEIVPGARPPVILPRSHETRVLPPRQ